MEVPDTNFSLKSRLLLPLYSIHETQHFHRPQCYPKVANPEENISLNSLKTKGRLFLMFLNLLKNTFCNVRVDTFKAQVIFRRVCLLADKKMIVLLVDELSAIPEIYDKYLIGFFPQTY